MSPIYFGGTDCPVCGATIPEGEPCRICALRAQLAEKDREIERLKAHPVMVEHLHYMKLGDIVRLEEDLAASQAREREAVERAEKAEHHERVAQDALSSADCRYAGRVAEMGGSHCPIGEPCDRCAADRLERKLESALAAARKALEKIAQAPGDNIGVWCRSTAIKALEFPEGHKPGCRYGEPPTTFMDGGYPCTCGYRAALNGDSHEQI